MDITVVVMPELERYSNAHPIFVIISGVVPVIVDARLTLLTLSF